jgi:hypothetical protein
MAYTRGSNANIIVGAAAFYISAQGQSTLTASTIPTAIIGQSYKDTLSNSTIVRNIGYTNNGIELTFTPTFGDVVVDQLLDVAKLYKSGMQVTLKTSFAEATLENLLVSIGQKGSVLNATATGSTWTESLIGTPSIGQTGTNASVATTAQADGNYIDILSGDLGDYPVERSVIAVGPGPQVIGAATINAGNPGYAGDGLTANHTERVYIAYRAVSITNVTVTAKRDAATMFDVEFRLLPDNNGVYGKIVDRTW